MKLPLTIIISLILLAAITIYLNQGWFFGVSDNDIKQAELIIGPRTVFAANETVSLKIDLGKTETRTKLDPAAILKDSTIEIIDPDNNSAKENFNLDLVSGQNGEHQLKINPKKRTLKPGRYKVEARFVTSQGIKDFSQDFYWGVLALNTNKSIYLPNEKAYLQMGVVDDKGDTVCDAQINLQIASPQGKTQELTTENGQVISNPQCGPNNVIDTPDYYAYYQLTGPGIYQIKLTAEMENGRQRSIQDFIEVKTSVPFEVERIGPTRIYPISPYEMRIKIRAGQEFSGNIVETVPRFFEILNQESGVRIQGSKGLIMHGSSFLIQEQSGDDEKKLIWQNVSLNRGDEFELFYTFDAPNVSPEFYLLGPLTIGDWQETRQWQIAADAPETLSLWVDGFGNEDCGKWSLNGSTPYLDAQDWDTSGSYIKNADRNANCGNFPFENTAQSGTITGVTLYIYAVSASSTDFSAWLSGSDTSLGPPASWGWVNTDVSGILTSWDDINNAYVLFDRDNNTNESQVDAAYLYVDYSTNSAPAINSVSDFPDPQSVGGDITFELDWSDPDSGDQVKIHICKNTTITGQTCDAPGSWCDTSSFSTMNPLSCHYNAQAADVGGSPNSYYAFVCDDDDACSAYSESAFSVTSQSTSVLIKEGVKLKEGTKIK